MRHLQRPLPALPCLSKYDYRRDKWSHRKPSSNERRAIWKKLKIMQSGFCCYCESIANKQNGHIEHFFRKGIDASGNSPYKHMTFDWSNLFGCCEKQTTCGHYKDKEGRSGPGNYDPNHLIKPDVDNPSNFFEFLPTGAINIKSGLGPGDDNKARETLRVLNLSSGALNGARKRQIDIFRRQLDTLLKLDVKDATILEQELEKIKQRVRKSEFQTAVLYALF